MTSLIINDMLQYLPITQINGTIAQNMTMITDYAKQIYMNGGPHSI